MHKKMKTFKRRFCLLLVWIMVVSMLPQGSLQAFAENESEVADETEFTEESIMSLSELTEEYEEEECWETKETEKIPEETCLEKVGIEKNLLADIIPAVVVNESYDKYLDLTLAIPEGVMLDAKTEYYYQVKVITHKDKDTTECSYLFKKESDNSQNVIIEMTQGFMEEGEEWSYDISVVLLQAENNMEMDTEAIESKALFMSKYNLLSDVEVMPYYAVKVTLEEAATTVYTTQQNVLAATVKLGKKTTVCDNLKAEDISYPGINNQEALSIRAIGPDLLLYVSAGAQTALGKHTIRVTAAAPEGMQPAQANIQITVMQGIEEGMLSVYTPSERLYKVENKNAFLTLKALFTKDEESGAKAKKQKVKWEIVSVNHEPLEETSALFGKISVVNGKITINKKYEVSQNREDNCFMVKATALDFKGNTVVAYSKAIEITGEIVEAGEIAILQFDQSGNAVVTARNNMSITSNLLGRIRVFKKDAPVQNSYTKAELDEWTFIPEALTYKSSNEALTILSDGTVTVSKPVNNVKITATLNDKSKQTVILKKLTVAYDKPEQLALKIEELDSNGITRQIGGIHSENTDYSISSSVSTRLKITLMKKDAIEESWKEVDSYVNFGLKVTNGEVIKKEGICKQTYFVGMSSDTLVLTLNDKQNKSVTTYKIVNTSYPTGKVPLLSPKGSLKAVTYDKEQTLTYTLKKNGKFVYDSNGKSVEIIADQSSKYKNDTVTARYEAFETAVGGLGVKKIEGGKFTLTFTTGSNKPLPAGNYKLWCTFGTLNNATFVPDTKAVAVTVTVKNVNLEKGSYKPVSQYNISVKEGGVITLKGKGANFLTNTVEFTNLKNANVNGGPNAFTKYFELDGKKLKLKAGLSDAEQDYICKAVGKADWTGYTDYSVSVRNTDGSYSKKTGTAKIELTMKDSVRKFTIESKSAQDKKTVVEPAVYADKKPVTILYAYAISGSYTAETNGNHILTLTPNSGSNEPVGGINNVVICVVPEGTYEANRAKLQALKQAWDNADAWNAASAEAAFAAAIKKYGIKVTAKVELPVRTVDNREYAEQVIDLVNKERRAAGLNPVELDEEVMYASFIRSKEIVQLFSHTRPNGTSCFTIFDELGISRGWAGENIAFGYVSPEHVMNGWMNSPGHRANILNSNFTHMGVGCYESGGRYYWVQLFISKP